MLPNDLVHLRRKLACCAAHQKTAVCTLHQYNHSLRVLNALLSVILPYLCICTCTMHGPGCEFALPRGANSQLVVGSLSFFIPFLGPAAGGSGPVPVVHIALWSVILCHLTFGATLSCQSVSVTGHTSH